jgi:endo-1,4-beta-xylanase
MKPSYIAPTQNSYNWTTADNMVNAARASGINVVGHTLLWHSQNASWMTNIGTDRNTALAAMKKYITDVVTHFKGKIYSWDVLNEVFPDGVSNTADWTQVMRKAGDSQAPNPWYVAIGSDFVYEGFLAARLADPGAILYYNDYNLDTVGKSTMVHNMVQAVNQKYAQEYPTANRKLIEGIGMQSHHNTSVTAAAIKTTLDRFKPLGVKISISELDVLGQTYQQFAAVGSGPNKHGSSTVTDAGLQTQAALYGQYMKLFLQYSDIIERVSLWGVTDNQSWRSAGLPLLFNPEGKAKPAYYSFAEALD